MSIGNAWLGSLQAQSLTTAQALAVGSMNLTSTVLSVVSVVDRVLVQLADQTEQISITVTPSAGTQYATLAYLTSTSGHSNWFWQPDRPLCLAAGDYVSLRVTNAGASGTAYGTVLVMY
jgi:hypothetical protein